MAEERPSEHRRVDPIGNGTHTTLLYAQVYEGRDERSRDRGHRIRSYEESPFTPGPEKTSTKRATQAPVPLLLDFDASTLSTTGHPARRAKTAAHVLEAVVVLDHQVEGLSDDNTPEPTTSLQGADVRENQARPSGKPSHQTPPPRVVAAIGPHEGFGNLLHRARSGRGHEHHLPPLGSKATRKVDCGE